MIRLSRWKLIVLGCLGVTVLGSIGGFIAYRHHQEMTEPSGLHLKFWIETVTEEEGLKKGIAECRARTWEYKIPENEIEDYARQCMRARGYEYVDVAIPDQPPGWGNKSCSEISSKMHYPFYEKCYLKPNIEDMAFDRKEKFRKEWEKHDREERAQKQ